MLVEIPVPAEVDFHADRIPFASGRANDTVRNTGPYSAEDRKTRGGGSLIGLLQYIQNVVPSEGGLKTEIRHVWYDAATDSYQVESHQYTGYDLPVPKKKGFLGGGLGSILGGIIGVALAPETGGLSLALYAGGGAAAGELVGSGAEAAITGGKFVVGDEAIKATIAGGVAGIGAGVASALGPTTSTVAGAALTEGVQGPVQAVTVTTEGLVSAGTAKALGAVASTVARTTLAPFAPMDASLGGYNIPTAPVRTVALPLSGGAVNTTGSTYFNYANTVDVPVAQPVGLFDSVLDSILPPFMHPDDLGRTDTPGDRRTPDAETNAGLIVATIIIVASAVAFSRSSARR